MTEKRTGANAYEAGLESVAANYVPLTPLSFLERSATVFPERAAWIHGPSHATYKDFYARCRRLASALARRGVGHGDTVSVIAPNVPALLEAHYGVPMIGAVLNALNIRLDPKTIAFTLEHCEAKVLLTDRAFSQTVRAALERLDRRPLVIDIDDALGEGGELLGETDYEAFLEEGDPDYEWKGPENEWQAISLNYTSGTTGHPKGVVYHHRGAYLIGIGNALAWGVSKAPVYLWTLPMFHCNGWCFTWTVCALGGTHVCLRKVEAGAVFGAIADHGVTHFCGAPIVLNMLVNARQDERRALDRTIEVMTAASPPPATVIAAMERMGFRVTHAYGLTETYGPSVVCAWHDEWDELPIEERAELKARQGVRYAVLEGVMVADPETLQPLPADGKSLGEVFMRGNIVMKGYFKDSEATETAFRGGWFHSGDLGVTHPNGYIELKDRAKDIIISGGENISTIEVEGALYKHPAVLEAAVVARPDEKWGETPCAFVTLKDGASATEAEIIAFCRDNLARFKVPKAVIFGALPKTATGKVQKHELRERASAL
ncbi:MAG: acyl-CoA synthetase [Alphaproteobacteria bacterium]